MNINFKEVEKLPDNTVERLSKYRQILYKYQYLKEAHINSSDLARVLDLTPEQVRRDLMLLGCTSTSKRKGYKISEILKLIDLVIDPYESINAILIGINKTPDEFLEYFQREESKINICTAFDLSARFQDENFHGIPCVSFHELAKVISDQNVKLAIFCESNEYAEHIFDILIKQDVKAILNLSSIHLNVPEDIYIEEVNLVSYMERLAYRFKTDNFFI